MARRRRKPTPDAIRSCAAAPTAVPAGQASSVEASRARVPPAWSIWSWQALAAVAGLVILTVAAYSGAGHLQFVPLDDQGYVYDNPHVKAGLTWAGVRWALTSMDQANWHPLTWLSHMLDVQLFGLAAGYHHLTSVAIHSLNSVLLFVLLARTTGAPGRSACVAALFAVHPLHVESVAWVAERKDVLSTFFWLLTTGAYVWYVRAPGRGRRAAVVACLALGLMSKPMLVTLPFVLLLLDVWPLGRLSPAVAAPGATPDDERAARRRAGLALVREKIPLFVLVACSGIVTLVAQSAGGAVRSFDFLPLGMRIANALTSYAAYLVKTAWPSRLAVVYPLPRSIPPWEWGGALAVLATVTWLVVRARRRQPYLLVGWLWYLGTLVPVIGLVQVGMQSMADRYTYVPLIGVFVMVVWGVADACARLAVGRVLLPVVSVVVILACGVTTRAQVAHWQDAWTLWTHALAVTRDNEAAHTAVGAMLGMQGRNEDALPHLREAVRIGPESPRALNGLGLALNNLGRYGEAVEPLSAAVRHRPDFADAQDNLGVALSASGRPGEALPRFLEALRLDPNRAATHRNAGLALMMFGRADEAIAHYEAALRLRPDYARAHNDLGFALMASGRNGEAKGHFIEALRLEPTLAEAHDNLGFALAAEGRLLDAVPHLVEAVRLRPDYEMARLHLGMALAAGGQLDEAAREFREALRLNPGNADAKRLLEKATARPR